MFLPCKSLLGVFFFSILTANAQSLLNATGSANNFVIVYPAALSGTNPPAGIQFTFRSNQNITGPATLQLNGYTARSIVKYFNLALQAGDIKSGQFVTVIYDDISNTFQMLSTQGFAPGNLTGEGTNGAVGFFAGTSAITVDGANLFWNNTSKRLGIGTTASGSTLAVAGGISVGNSYASVAAPANGMIIQSTVGIGIPNPAGNSRLHVVGTNNQRTLFIEDHNVSSGMLLSISSTSNLGSTGGSSYMLNILRMGSNINPSHTAYGINSAVSNTGTANTNIAGQFIASGGINNYAIIVPPTGGLVGIGTTSPGSRLGVSGGACIGVNYSSLLGISNGLVVQSFVGIGTPTPNLPLVVIGGISNTGTAFMQNAQINALSNGVLSVNGTGQVVLAPASASLSGSGTNGAVNFWTGTNTQGADGANFFWDNSNKRLGIGTATPGYPLEVAGGPVAGAGAYVNTSDARYKTHITDISNALHLVLQLQGVYFEWDTLKHPEYNFEKGRQIGYIAQELLKIIPEAASYDAKNDRYVVAYSKIIPLLSESIKAQQQLLLQLRSENANLTLQNIQLAKQSASLQQQVDYIYQHLGLDVKTCK